MSSETTMVAEQCRLQEWAAQIWDCQSRSAGMSVVEWCACHGMESLTLSAPYMVPVRPGLLQHQEQEDGNPQPGLDISIKGFSIHVTGATSMPLLAEVLRVVQHAE